MSTFCRIALGSHAPEISGFPSALRGAGPEGGQAGLALAGADPGAAAGACADSKAGMQKRISDRTRTSGPRVLLRNVLPNEILHIIECLSFLYDCVRAARLAEVL